MNLNSIRKRRKNGIARVILNRVHSALYPNTVMDVILGINQFVAITGNSSQTNDSRNPNTTSSRWEHSTYLACLLLTTIDNSEWDILIGNPIGERLNFSSYSYAKNHGNNVFRDNPTTSKMEYCDGGTWKKIKNVYVIGYGNVSSINSMFESSIPHNYSRNVYFDYE